MPKHRAVPEGKIRTVALVVPAFAAVRDPAEAFPRRLRLPTLLALAFAAFRSRAEASRRRLRPPAPAAALTGFSLARGTPFPSGPRTFWRGVAAFVQAASVTKILSAFQRLSPRSAVAFLLPTLECCASNPSRASPIYPPYPQASFQRWISVLGRFQCRCARGRNPITYRAVRAASTAAHSAG